jgi:hypothetical protein
MPAPWKMDTAWGGTLKSFAVGICVFFLGGATAAWVTWHNIHGLWAFADNILTGIAAGLLVFFYDGWRQSSVERKLHTIRMMNHHVRNALQVISAGEFSSDGVDQSTKVRDAVRRIEWALREVLPGENALADAAVPPNPEAPKKESAA